MSFIHSLPVYAIKFHESIKDWDIYSMKQSGKLVCYTVSQPIEKSNKIPEREPYIIVTRIAKNLYEFNASISKLVLKDKALIIINNTNIKLFTKENLGWTQNKDNDVKLIQLMKNNNILKLSWEENNHKKYIDQYSLTGFNKALEKLNEICQ